MNPSFTEMIELSWCFDTNPDQAKSWLISQQAWAQTDHSSSYSGTAAELIRDIFFDESRTYVEHCVPAQIQTSCFTLHHLTSISEDSIIISSEQHIIAVDRPIKRFASGLILATVTANKLCSFLIGNTLILLSRINDEWNIYEHNIEWSLGEFSAISNVPTWLKLRWDLADRFTEICVLMGHRLNLQTPERLTFPELTQINPGALITHWATQLSVAKKRVLNAFLADQLHRLQDRINALTEDSVLIWLEQRDDLQALADIVSAWQPQLISELRRLDRGFPFASFSAIHTDSEQLYSSRLQNPDAWWSQWCRDLH